MYIKYFSEPDKTKNKCYECFQFCPVQKNILNSFYLRMKIFQFYPELIESIAGYHDIKGYITTNNLTSILLVIIDSFHEDSPLPQAKEMFYTKI